MKKENLVIYWTLCSVTGDLIYSAMAQDNWVRWECEADERYRYLGEIEVDAPNRNEVVDKMTTQIDANIAELRLKIIKCEEKKASLLALEHQS